MTPVFGCGFECGSAHFASTGTIVTSPVRSPGLRALRLNAVAAAEYASVFSGEQTGFPTSTTWVFRAYVRFATLPNATIPLVHAAANACKDGAWFNAADNKIYTGSRITGSPVLGSSGVSVTTGQWYRIDVKVDGSANPHLIDVQVDGSACAQLSSAASVLSGDELALGSDVINYTGDLYFDDVLVSTTLADYPIGDGYILGYVPNADGTHNIAGANDFERTLTGTDITNSTTDAYLLIDDRPLPTTAVDFINGVAPPNATDYVEWQYEDSSESTAPRLVAAIFIHHDAGGSGTNNFTVTLREATGGTSANVFSGTANQGSTLARKGACFATVPGTSDAWTTVKFNALRSRFLVSDASPDPYLDGIMLEAEFASGPPTRDAPAALGTLTGAAQAPKANPAPAPSAASFNAVAYAATTVAEKRVAAGLATVAGAAQAPSDQVRASAAVAPVVGAAQSSIASEGIPSSLAAVTGAAQNAAARPEARAQAGVATATDAGQTPAGRPEARASAALATVTDAAQTPTVLTGGYAPAELASASIAGQAPIVVEHISAALATIDGAAQAPTVTLGTFAPAGLAGVTVAAQDATGVGFVETKAYADLATVTSTGSVATAFGERRVDAPVAAATGASPDSFANDAPVAALATTTLEAHAALIDAGVSAALATVMGDGLEPTVETLANETSAHAELATLAIDAYASTACGETRVSAPVASASASAPGPAPADATFAPTTDVPATAQPSIAHDAAVAPNSTATATAQVAAGVAVRLAPAALAEATSAGQGPSDRVHTFTTNATVEISGYDATVNTSSAVQAPAALATIVTTAYDGIAALAVKPATGTATGAAQTASGRAEKRPQPDAATVTTTANDATGVGERRAPAAVGTASAAAQTASAFGGISVAAGLGTIAVVGRTPAIQIRVWADLATTTVTANDASVTTSSSVTAQAGLATATAAALASVTAIAPMSALATITTAAQAPSVFLRVAPATAIVQATGLAAPGGIGAIAPAGSVVIATPMPSFMLAIHADLAAALAAALAPEIGNPPIFLSPSTGMHMPIGATMNPSSGSRLVGR